MQEMKELMTYMREHRIVIVTTALGVVIGAVLGAIAFYCGWLG